MSDNELEILQAESLRLRDKQHILASEITTIKCKAEIQEKRMEKIAYVASAIDVLEQKVEDWMANTNEYRKSLCAKLDSITEKVSALPCKERKVFYESISVQARFMWGAVSAIVMALVYLGLKSIGVNP